MKENNDSAPQNEERDEKKSDFISRACYNHGFFCATHPRLVIFVTGVIILACSAPLLKLPLFGGATTAEWITLSPSELSLADSKGRTMQMLDDKENTIPRWFVGEPLLYVQQFVMAVHINPWRAGVLSNEMLREALKPAFNLSQVITDFTYKGDGQEVSLSDVCLSVTSQTPKQARASWTEYLPANSCVVLSPANFWNRDYSRFANDFKILDDIYQSKGRPAFSITLKEFIFGVPLKHTGIYPALQSKGTDHTIRYAVTVLLKTHDVSYLEGLKKELEKLHPLNPVGSSHSHGSDSRDYVVHIYYKGESGSFIEIWHLCLMYFLVFLYLTFSVAKIEMVKSKIGLAFSAVITIVASLTMAAGLCSFFGLVPTLNSSEIFPYLVIVIGVENIMVITKSVVSTPFHLDVEIRVAQGLSREGRYIFKNLVIEMALLVAGHFTYVPAVQEFCLFAVVGLSTDFFLQMVFFATILSIDMRRLELSDLERITAYQQSLGVAAHSVSSGQLGSAVTPVHPVTPGSPVAVSTPISSSSIGSSAGSSFTIVTSGTTTQQSRSSTVVAKQFPPSPPQFLKLIPPLPSASVQQQTPSRCPVPAAARKLPKRLNFAYFLARTRLVQKICMVCAVLYFLFMVYSSVTVLEAEDASNSVKVQMKNASSVTSREPVDIKLPHTEGLKERLILKGKEKRKSQHNDEDNKEPLAKEAERVKKAAEDDSPKTPDPSSRDGSGWYFMGQQKNALTAEEVWRSLSKRHWPQLLGYYNMSLVSRYISVLPPVYLGTHVDTTTILSKYVRQQQSVSDDKQTLAGKAAAADTIVEQELSSGQTSNRDKANSDYFLHALYCVILGVVVMIVLFFICKFLNDCQIDPKMRLRGFGREDLLESLPLILDGHMQAVEHLECLGSTIVSVCLSGRIWVWEASSGDCRKVMSRNSTQDPPSLRKRKKRESSRARKELTFDSEPGFPSVELDMYSTTPDIFSDSESSIHLHSPREDAKRLNSRLFTLSTPQQGSYAKLCEESIPPLESQKVLSSSSAPATAKSQHRQSHGEIQAEQFAEMEEQNYYPMGTSRTHNRQRSNGNIREDQSVTLEEQRKGNPGKTGGEYSLAPKDNNPCPPSTPESCKAHKSHGSHSVINGEQCTNYGSHTLPESVRDNIRTYHRQGSDGCQDQVNARHPQFSEGQGVHNLDVTIKKDFKTHHRQDSDGYQDLVVRMNGRHPQNIELQGIHKSDMTIRKDHHTHHRQGSDGYQDSVVQMSSRYQHIMEGHGLHNSGLVEKKDFQTHRRQGSDGHQDAMSHMSSRYQHNMEGNVPHKSDLTVKKDFQAHRRQGSGGYPGAVLPANTRYPQSVGHGPLTSDVTKPQELRTHRRQGSDGYQDLIVPANKKYVQSTEGHKTHNAERTVEVEVRTHRRQGSGCYPHAADSRYSQNADVGKLYGSDKKEEHKTHYQQSLSGQQDSAPLEECGVHISDETVKENFRTHRRQGSDGRISSGYNSNSNENVAAASSSVESYNSHHRHKSERGRSHQQRQSSDAVVPSSLQLTEDVKKQSRQVATEEQSNTVPRSQRRRSQQEQSSQMSGSLESCGSSGAVVYDFKRYLPSGGLKHASSRVSLGSWSSGSDDSDTEWPSCSEASYEEFKSARGSGRTSSHGNYKAAPVKPCPVVWCMCCNGDFVVTGCNDGAVEFWSITSGKLVCSFTDSEGVTNVSFLSESFQLVVARLDGCLDFLRLGGPPGSTHLTPQASENSPVNRSSPRAKRKNNPDSGVSATEHAPASAIVCRLIQKVRAHLKPVSLLRVLPGRVITGSQDRTLKVFRTDECVCVYTLYGHGDGITALFVDKTSPSTVVSGAANGGVRVWDIHSGECLSHLRGHVKAVMDVTCTAVHLISVSLDNVMCIWDRKHNTCLHRIVQFPGLCSNVIILSKHLFVTGGQGCIMLWDISSGRRVRTISLGNDDASVFVRRVRLSGNATIVCDYGKELRVLTFPALLNKSE